MAEPQTIFDEASQGSDPNAAITPPPSSEYSIDTNPNRAEPLNPKTEYMVMDKKTGNTIAVPFSIGDRQRDSIIQGSIYNNPQDFKDGVYEKLWKPMIESGGANANVFQNPAFVSEAMGKGAMQGGTASIYRPSGEESQLFDKFAHDPELIGQFGGFGATALGGGIIAKGILKAAMTIPAVAEPLANIFTSNIAKLGLEGAEKVGQVAAASTVAGSTMGIYDAISNTQNQLKDNEERVKNGEDTIPLDWGKIGAHAVGQGALFALVGGIGAQIARPLIGMSGIEATSQVAKELAITGGSMWAIAKAQGSTDEDAGLMAFAAVALHSISLPGSVADRTNAIKQMKYAMADHIQMSNDNIDPSAAYEIGKGVVNKEIEKELSKTTDQSEEYQKWLQQNADDGKPAPSYMNVPLHPAGEGRAEEAARNVPRNNAEQYSDEDISDIKRMMSWERDQTDGGMNVSGGKQTGLEREVVNGITSGHSQAMQAIGPQESFRLMDKAANGDKLMQGGRYKEQEKMQKLLDDFRVNVKPHLDDQDFRIASNQESLGNLMKNLAVKIVDPAEMNWPSEEEQPMEEQSVLEEEKEAEEPAVNPMTGGVQEETGKFGEHNTLFTEAMANQAREAIKSKLSGLHSGIDPTALKDFATIGGYYAEAGLRDFGKWSNKMVEEFGEAIKPHLDNLWKEINSKISGSTVVSNKEDVDNLINKAKGFSRFNGEGINKIYKASLRVKQFDNEDEVGTSYGKSNTYTIQTGINESQLRKLLESGMDLRGTPIKGSSEKAIDLPRLDTYFNTHELNDNIVDSLVNKIRGQKYYRRDSMKFGADNKIFTREIADNARAAINSKLSGLHSGVDPTVIGDMLKIGGYHFEGGVREFGAWSKKMIDDLGEHVKPYLQDVWDKLQKQAPQMAQPKEATEDELAKQEYFPLKPLGIKEIVGKRGEIDLNKTGRDIVKRYIGRYQEQVVRVQDLADDMRGLEKDKAQQDAMSIFASVGGDEEKLKEWIAKADALPDGDYNKEYWEKEVKPAAELALNLSDGAKEAIGLGNQYFKESGLAMKAVGAIRTFLNNYGINRLYQDEPAERVLKGNDFDNPEQSTGHAKKRFYENMIDAVIGGKRFKTMNYPDLIGIHGEEAASVTVGRQYAQESAPKDMGGWVNKDSVPAGWSQVGNMSRDIPMKDMDTKEAIMDEQGNQKILHQVFVAPKAIADDMSVITDPDNLKKVGFMAKAGALNNAVKSFNVMIGLFHDKQFILQKLASPGGVKALKDTFTGQLGQLMQTKDFKESRLRMLRSGVGMSGKIQANIDVIKVANAKGAENSWLNKITSLPVIKQAAQLVDWHKNNLFQVMGEYYKVDNFRRNTAEWDLKNPDATDEERLQADRGFAQASNNAFGGHNWAGLGFSKEAITAARTAWFAPDWLYSALRTGSSAITDWKGIANSQGTEGNATRAIIVKNLIYGTAATQLANYMINGHFTDKNAKGHTMEIELSPKNHISMYPAATGELIKLMSDIVESGAIGVSRYLQGKLSPILRLGATWASHTSYAGQDITKETGGIGAVAAKPIPDEYKDAVAKQVNYVAELASTIAPLPFVVQPGPAGYVGEQIKNAVEGKPADLAGSATIVSGLSRFSQGESEERKQQDIDDEVSKGLAKNDMTAANKYLASGDISQERIDELQAKADETPLEKSYKNLSVEKIIKKADGNIDGMNADDKDSLKTMLDDKYTRMQSAGKASPNEIKRVGDLLENFYDKHKIQ